MIINSNNESLGLFYIKRNESVMSHYRKKTVADKRLRWVYSIMKKVNYGEMSDTDYFICNSSVLLHCKYSFHSYSYFLWPTNMQSILGMVLYIGNFCQQNWGMQGKASFLSARHCLSACIGLSVCSFSSRIVSIPSRSSCFHPLLLLHGL